jgi:hypothetical protein
MNESYEPNGKYLESLEWQLASEFRRRSRLRAYGKIAVSRRAASLIIVAGVLLTGVAATKAADLIRESWRKSIEVARVEMDVRLKTAFAEFKREQVARAETQASKGLIRQEEVEVTKLSAEYSALDLGKSQLNLEEVEASGEAPRDEIYAPVVGGRDFVGERMQVEVRRLELNLELRRARLEQRLRRLAEKGLVAGSELEDFQAESATQASLIQKARERFDLRRRFVSGDLSAREVEIQDKLTLAERDLGQAQSELDYMRKQLAHTQALQASGQAQESDVRALEFGLNYAQEEVALATLEIDILKKVK